MNCINKCSLILVILLELLGPPGGEPRTLGFFYFVCLKDGGLVAAAPLVTVASGEWRVASGEPQWQGQVAAQASGQPEW